MTEDDWLLCDCRNTYGEHAPGGGPCGGLDSYGVPCECPSFQEMSSFEDDD